MEDTGQWAATRHGVDHVGREQREYVTGVVGHDPHQEPPRIDEAGGFDRFGHGRTLVVHRAGQAAPTVSESVTARPMNWAT